MQELPQQQKTYDITRDYMDLDQNDQTIVEYVWIGGTGMDIRSKAKVFKGQITSLSQVSDWNYDGSSCFQATGHNSEITIRPVALFNDPFRRGNNKIVLCETFKADGTPAKANFRYYARQVFDQIGDQDPWFGIEQEYTILTVQGWPLGFKTDYFPRPQGLYYCSIESDNCFGRAIMEEHLKACLFAGIQIYGTNAEVMPGQWEFQIGTCKGIAVGDHMWMARYILARIAAEHGVLITYHPKPVSGDWNGAGAHTNFSTKSTREEGGYQKILEAIEKLRANHQRHIQVYGGQNELRLTGHHETSPIHEFSHGVADRGRSVRIPRQTVNEQQGYFEDRRPAANCDPYVVSAIMVDTVCLDGKFFDNGIKAYIDLYEEWSKLRAK